jgi:hypothetical protein
MPSTSYHRWPAMGYKCMHLPCHKSFPAYMLLLSIHYTPFPWPKFGPLLFCLSPTSIAVELCVLAQALVLLTIFCMVLLVTCCGMGCPAAMHGMYHMACWPPQSPAVFLIVFVDFVVYSVFCTLYSCLLRLCHGCFVDCGSLVPLLCCRSLSIGVHRPWLLPC